MRMRWMSRTRRRRGAVVDRLRVVGVGPSEEAPDDHVVARFSSASAGCAACSSARNDVVGEHDGAHEQRPSLLRDRSLRDLLGIESPCARSIGRSSLASGDSPTDAFPVFALRSRLPRGPGDGTRPLGRSCASRSQPLRAPDPACSDAALTARASLSSLTSQEARPTCPCSMPLVIAVARASPPPAPPCPPSIRSEAENLSTPRPVSTDWRRSPRASPRVDRLPYCCGRSSRRRCATSTGSSTEQDASLARWDAGAGRGGGAVSARAGDPPRLHRRAVYRRSRGDARR